MALFSTSHGKGPCDGVGGALKRAAAKASLQRPLEKQIINATDLFEYAKSLPKINVSFSSKEEYGKEIEILESRFNKSIAIPGTKTLHAFLPFSKTEVITKVFSNSDESSEPIKIIRQ